MIIKAQNVQKCTKDWHLPAHDLTFPPILPRNQRCYGLIGQHLAPAHFGNLDAFKAGIHLTKAVHLEPEAHEAPRVWQERKWCEAHFLGPGCQHLQKHCNCMVQKQAKLPPHHARRCGEQSSWAL